MQRGLTIFLTGLPAAGKTTIAHGLADWFERESRPVTLLDGDVVRQDLSAELGFSKEHRDLNIRRIGFVAAEITRHGGTCICSPIAPYEAARKAVRTMVERFGRFLLVYVSTPVEVCESRDPKGLYAKARAGLISCVTGVTDPYEVPTDADIVIDTSVISTREAVKAVLQKAL